MHQPACWPADPAYLRKERGRGEAHHRQRADPGGKGAREELPVDAADALRKANANDAACVGVAVLGGAGGRGRRWVQRRGPHEFRLVAACAAALAMVTRLLG